MIINILYIKNQFLAPIVYRPQNVTFRCHILMRNKAWLCGVLNAIFIISCVSADPETCALGLAQDSTWVVTVVSLCADGHSVRGTYVDSGSSNSFSRIYVKFDSQLTIVKYLYLMQTLSNPISGMWYISTNLLASNSVTGTYDVRFTVPDGNKTVTAVIGSQAYAKCMSTSTASGILVQDADIISVALVVECKCDYNYELRAGSCQLCGDTRFKNTISNSSCRNCPNHKAFTDIKTCVCLPGSSGIMGETCVSCLAGFYNANGGSVGCSACPLYTSSGINSNTITNCTCNRGYSGPNSGPCAICAAGKYKDTQGDNLCSDCPEGTYSNFTGATTPNTCRNCTSQSTAPAGSNNQSACACAPGWYGMHGQNCSKCGTDTFSSNSGSSSCTQCPFGRSAPLGGDSIDACICMKGNDAQCECAAGSTNVYQFEFSVSTFACNLQEVGRGVFIDTGLQHQGSLVYYSTTPAPKFLYRNDEEWWISTLFNALTYDIKFSACASTPESVDHLASSTWNCGNALSCGGNIQWNSGGQTSVTNVSRCVCKANFVRSPFGICTQCPPGFFKYVSLTGSSECRPCSAHSSTLDPAEGVNGCGCNVGFSGPNNGVCIQCDPGTHKFGIGPASCQKCPEILHPLHTAFNVSSRVLNCNTCQISHAWNHGTQQCEQCASDEFNNRAGDSVCFKCVATPEYFPLQKDMILWFKFDNIPERRESPHAPNNANIVLVDSSIHQRHGKYQWNPHGPNTQSGRVLNIYDLNDFVEGNASYYNGNHDVRMSSVYFGGDATVMTFFKFGYDGRFLEFDMKNGWWFNINRDNNQLVFSGRYPYVDIRTIIPGAGLQAGIWYHFALVIERGLGRWTVYIDGKIVPLTQTTTFPQLDAGDWYKIKNARHKMDDFRGYTRALTRLEVRTAHLQRDPNEICGLTESNGVTCPRLCRVDAGYQRTLSGANVELCPRNSYQNGYSLTCEPCPIGSSTNTSGNSDVSVCVCGPGYSRNGRATGACVACDAGTFKAVSGSDACTLCAAGQFSDAGAVFCGCDKGFTGDSIVRQCEVCEAGKYKNTTGSAECTLCGTQRTSTAGSRHISNCQCNVGFMGPDTGLCEPEELCPLNADKAIGSLRTSCLCNAGFTGPNMWGPCESCVVGKYKEATGSASCDYCFPDSTSVAGSEHKEDCLCNAGFSKPNGIFCEACAAGQYKVLLGSAACTMCPANSFSSAASTRLVDCSCDEGFTGGDGMNCTACASGKFKDVRGSALCRSCGSNSVSQTNSRSEDECFCRRGYRRNFDADIPGTHSDIATLRTGVGGWRLVRYLPLNSQKWFQNDHLRGVNTNGIAYDKTNQWTIPFGEFDQFLFGTFGLRYWIHLTKAVATSATAFNGGTPTRKSVIKSSRNSSPHAVALHIDGLSSTATSGRPFISVADHPTEMVYAAVSDHYIGLVYVDQGFGVWVRVNNPEWCRLCERDTYTDVIGASECKRCPPYSTSLVGSSDETACICIPGYTTINGGPCVACPMNTSKPNTGSGVCQPCPPNMTSTAGSTNCQCAIGFTGPNNGPCVACAPGTSKGIPGDTTCVTCPSTTTSSSVASSHCVCITGMHGQGLVWGHERIQTGSGLLQSDIVDCTACPVGYIISPSDGTCVPCPVDTYNPTALGIYCIACPNNTQSRIASSSQLDCKCRGAVNNDTGFSGPDGGPCEVCPPHYYKGTAFQSGSCDKVVNSNTSMTFPHTVNTPVRRILAVIFRENWVVGNQVHIHRRGRRGINDVVLTYDESLIRGGYWSPSNVNPLLRIDDKYRFFVQHETLLQKNASESGLSLRLVE